MQLKTIYTGDAGKLRVRIAEITGGADAVRPIEDSCRALSLRQRGERC